MRKYCILWVLVLCFSFGFCVEASTGSLEIRVDEKEEFAFTYTKVADYKNGEFILREPFKDSGVQLNGEPKNIDLKKCTEILASCKDEKTYVKTKNQVAQIDPLSEGVYLIEGVHEEGYDIANALVSIPQWNADEDYLSYHITVMPKIQRVDYSVDTGDDTNLIPLMLLCIMSLCIIAGVSGRAYFLKDK